MKLTVTMTSIDDKLKAMAWFRKQIGHSLKEISGIVSRPMPAALATRDDDIGDMVRYCRSVEDLRNFKAPVSGQKLYVIPVVGVGWPQQLVPKEECGFSYEVRVELTAGEERLVADRISELSEHEAAFEWLAAQPEDVKRKVQIIVGANVPRC